MDCTIRRSETRGEAARPPVADRGPDDGECRVPLRRNPLPGGIAGPERPPEEGWDGMHIPTLPRGTPSVQGGGSLRPRPQVPARRSRPGSRGPTGSRPASCGFPGSHARVRFPCTSTPMSMCTSGSATGSAERSLNPGSGNAVPSRWSGSSTAASFMPRMAFSKRSIPLRTAAMVDGAHGRVMAAEYALPDLVRAPLCPDGGVRGVSRDRGAVAQFPVRAVHFHREALGRRISNDHRGISGDLRAAGSRIIDDLGSPRGYG